MKYQIAYKVLTEDELNNKGADSKSWGYVNDYVEGASLDDIEYEATDEFEQNWEYGALEDAQGNPLDLGGRKEAGDWTENADGSYEQWVAYVDENGYKIYLIQRATARYSE